MSAVELTVSVELEAWLVTEIGLVDFRAIRVFLSSKLVDTPTTECLVFFKTGVVSGDDSWVSSWLSDGIPTTWWFHYTDSGAESI